MNTASNSLVIDFEHTTVEKVDHLLTHITNVRQDFKDDLTGAVYRGRRAWRCHTTFHSRRR